MEEIYGNPRRRHLGVKVLSIALLRGAMVAAVAAAVLVAIDEWQYRIFRWEFIEFSLRVWPRPMAIAMAGVFAAILNLWLLQRRR